MESDYRNYVGLHLRHATSVPSEKGTKKEIELKMKAKSLKGNFGTREIF